MSRRLCMGPPLPLTRPHRPPWRSEGTLSTADAAPVYAEDTVGLELAVTTVGQ